jgi:hypothetical protein
VTLVATVVPRSVRRVPPLAEPRDVAIEKTRISVVRVSLGVLFTVGGIVLSCAAIGGLARSGGSARSRRSSASSPPRHACDGGLPTVARFRKMTVASRRCRDRPRRTAATASAPWWVSQSTLFTVFPRPVKARRRHRQQAQFGGDLRSRHRTSAPLDSARR